MAKKPTITSITSGYASTNTLNDNFTALRDAFDNTLSLDGSTPNSMTSDLNLNNNDILNASRILVGGVDYIATALSYKNDAETAKTAAEAAQAAAELAYDNFDDRYLGSKASDPTVDNDGNALLDGALYYDTVNTVMKFYDTSTSTWYRTTPTTSDQANIDIVAGNTTNINTVAGISSDVTTVAGISSDVTTVAADGTDIGTVATSISNVNTAATNISNINTVAGISANVTTVAGNTSNINTVATDISNVNTVAGQTTNLQNVTDNLTAIQNAATNATNAATSASNASTSETNAATSASNASTSETNAASSATAAAASAAAAASSADFFDDVYLGSKASDPSVDNDGDPLNAGDLYFNTTSNTMRVYSGSAWQDAAVDSSGFVQTTGDTMTGDLDIQGTLTSDGLTVESNSNSTGAIATLSNTNLSTDGNTVIGALVFDNNDDSANATDAEIRAMSDSTAGRTDLYLRTGDAGTLNDRLKVRFNGDISFYEDTGTTPKFFWDASAESLGIGKTDRTATSVFTVQNFNDVTTNTAEFYNDNGNRTFRFAQDTSGNADLLLEKDDGTDTVLISTHGDSYFNGGDVGIGTSSPARPLQVAMNNAGATVASLKNSGATAAMIGFQGSGSANDSNVRIGVSDDTDFTVTTANSEAMRIDSSGNVGIGTSSPDDKLHVYSTSSLDHIKVDGPAAINRNVQFSTAGSARWNIYANSTAENGSNAGSDLSIARYTDAGAYNGIAMFIERSTGNVGIGTSSPTFNSGSGLEISRSGTASLRVERTGATASSGEFFAGNGQVVVNSVSNTPLIFRTNNTDRMRIDSSGNVGIGTSSPVGRLSLQGAAGTNGKEQGILLKYSNGTEYGALGLNNSSGWPQLMARAGAGITFHTNSDLLTTNEAMRIDSSGNLLVGMTSANTNNDGAGIRADGLIHGKRADVVATFNRKTTDGTVVQISKDNTVVGSIGTAFGYMHLGEGVVGLGFRGADNTIYPYSVTGAAARDGAIKLGSGSYRFHSMYLSDGVYLGGTGSANKLDDYEEGEYYVTVTASTSGSYTMRAGYTYYRYVKIGQMVHIQGMVSLSGASSPVGEPQINLPFTVGAGTNYSEWATGSALWWDNSASVYTPKPIALTTGSTAYIQMNAADLAAYDYLVVGFSYYTA